jgi:hypothetical protein
MDITIKLDPVDVGDLARKFPQETEGALRVWRDKLLVAIEQIQIHKYTGSAHPSALRYKRTFTLRKSSQTKAVGDKLPNIGGVWWADEGIAPYAREVIGPAADQKPVHRGRWMTLEQIAAEAEGIGGPLAEETLQYEMDF